MGMRLEPRIDVIKNRCTAHHVHAYNMCTAHHTMSMLVTCICYPEVEQCCQSHPLCLCPHQWYKQSTQQQHITTNHNNYVKHETWSSPSSCGGLRPHSRSPGEAIHHLTVAVTRCVTQLGLEKRRRRRRRRRRRKRRRRSDDSLC